MNSKPKPRYVTHSLVKYICLECERAFIVSGHYSKQVNKIHCPYCNSTMTADTVAMIDTERLDELGCMAISHLEESEG